MAKVARLWVPSEGFSCSVFTPFLCAFPVHEPSFSQKQTCRGWMTWLESVVLCQCAFPRDRMFRWDSMPW